MKKYYKNGNTVIPFERVLMVSEYKHGYYGIIVKGAEITFNNGETKEICDDEIAKGFVEAYNEYLEAIK